MNSFTIQGVAKPSFQPSNTYINAPIGKKRNVRGKAFTANQYAILTRYYEIVTTKPKQELIHKIAQETALRPAQVKTWFQNNRSRSKRKAMSKSKEQGNHNMMQGMMQPPFAIDPKMFNMQNPMFMNIQKSKNAQTIQSKKEGADPNGNPQQVMNPMQAMMFQQPMPFFPFMMPESQKSQTVVQPTEEQASIISRSGITLEEEMLMMEEKMDEDMAEIYVPKDNEEEESSLNLVLTL
ncbi:hypothetical protein PCE1_000285 [Barthelona sp. PCE]